MLLSNSSEKDSIKRSLVLAGGGMRVAYQGGVLKALEEAALSFQHVDGTSGGTMNAAMLFSDLTPTEICERWRSLKLSGFVSFLPLKNYLNPFKLKAFGSADGIIKKVFPHLGIDIALINQNKKSEATFNVCNFSTKQNISLSQRDLTLPHLIAGISLPIFMPAVKIDGDWYSDSVWIKDANLMEAVRRGAEEIWLVWCIGNSPEYKDGSFLQYVHMIEMSANGVLLEELQSVAELNERIQKGDSPYGQKNVIKLHVIKPHFPLPLDPDFFMGSINAHELVNIGYQNTKQYLKNQPPLGVALDWRATAMTEPGLSIVSRQVYQGKTNIQKHELRLRLRAETYKAHEDGSAASLQSLTLYGDISFAGINNQPFKSGNFTWGSFVNPCNFSAVFVTGDGEWQLEGKVTIVAFWKMLVGRGATLGLTIYKENVVFDEVLCNINLWRMLLITYKKWRAKK